MGVGAARGRGSATITRPSTDPSTTIFRGRLARLALERRGRHPGRGQGFWPIRSRVNRKRERSEVRVVKFQVGPQQLLLAYHFDSRRNVVQLLDVSPHENFYRDLQRYLAER